MDSDAVDSAATRLANLLQTPADLHQVEGLRARVAAERASKEAQLKGAMRHHLDSANFALYLMKHSLEEFDNVTSNFAQVERLVTQSQAQMSAYPLIKTVYETHRNFATTLQLCNDLVALPERIKRVEQLLEEDSKNLLRAHNMMYTYIEIYKLEQLRDETFARINGASSTSERSKKELTEHFAGVQMVADQFEQRLMSIAGKLITLTHSHASTIVKIVKVVEFGEQADMNAEKKGLGAKPRLLREKLFGRLQRSIEEQFEGTVSQFTEGEDVDASLRSLNFMIDELTLVMDEIAPRFPPDWDVFMFYVKSYHQQMSIMLIDLVRSRKDPKEILMLFNWVESYYKNLKSRLGIDPENLAPRLLDEHIPKLTSDYVKLVHEKVVEWTNNMLHIESADFKNRDKPPDKDISQLYITSAPVILFQMLNQQVDLASTSGREQLVMDVILECCEVLQVFQESLTSLAKTEETAYASNRDEAKPGLIEYLIAFVNNQSRSSEFTLQLVERIKRDVRGHAALIVEKRLTEVEEGFRNVAKAGLASIRAIVFMDVTSFLEGCFTPKWYTETLVENTVATFEDYANDIQKHLTEYYFNKFMYECLDDVLIGYLSACGSRHAVFRGSQCAAKIDSDMKALTAFFSRYLIEKRVAKVLQVVVDIGKLLTNDTEALPPHILHMKMSYRDAPSNMYEKLMAKRSDFVSRGAVQKTMSEVNALQLASDAFAIAGSDDTMLGKIKFV